MSDSIEKMEEISKELKTRISELEILKEKSLEKLNKAQTEHDFITNKLETYINKLEEWENRVEISKEYAEKDKIVKEELEKALENYETNNNIILNKVKEKMIEYKKEFIDFDAWEKLLDDDEEGSILFDKYYKEFSNNL